MNWTRLHRSLLESERAWLCSVGILYGVPLLALAALPMRWTVGPRWLLDGGWFGSALMAPLLAVFSAVIFIGPYAHLVRPHLERSPALLRMGSAAMFFALPWSAICYWLAPKGATGSMAEWALVVLPPVLLAAVLVERFESVLSAAIAFALAAVIPLFVVSDVRAPFLTLWTYGGGGADALLAIRALAAGLAVGAALVVGDEEWETDRPLLLSGALAVSALLSAVVTPLVKGQVLFDGAALAMPILVMVSRRSLRLADWAPRIAVAQVVASALVTAMALRTSHGESAVPAAAHGAFAIIVGLALSAALQKTPTLVRVRR